MVYGDLLKAAAAQGEACHDSAGLVCVLSCREGERSTQAKEWGKETTPRLERHNSPAELEDAEGVPPAIVLEWLQSSGESCTRQQARQQCRGGVVRKHQGVANVPGHTKEFCFGKPPPEECEEGSVFWKVTPTQTRSLHNGDPARRDKWQG